MKILFLILYLISATSPLMATPAATTAGYADLDPNSVWIMEETLSDGTLMSTDISLYPRKNQWLIPLGELSDSLGLAISVSPILSLGQGFILTEDRTFELNVKRCEVVIRNKAQKYDCNEAVVFENDIYISDSLLAKWLPIKITVNSYRSQLIITAKEKLPIQLKREREQLAERSKGLLSDYDPGFPPVQPSYKLLDGPLLDEQLTLNRATTDNQSDYRFRHNTQLAGEVLGLETYGFVGGDERIVDNWRLTFSRRSVDGKVFGPLGVTQAQFMDVDLPRVNLVSAGQSGRGFLFSSYPLDTPVNFEFQDFLGNLPQGWEVLLYRNEVLLDRQVANSTGRYLFRGIPLLYGRNVFRLSFFGPYGETRDEYRTYNIDSSLLRPGTMNYQLGLAFLKDSSQRISMNYAGSLNKNFSLNAGWLQDMGGQNAYTLVGLTGLNDLFLFTTNCAFNLNGGKACEWGEQMGIGSATIGAKYTRLFDFHSELFNFTGSTDQVSQISANLNYAIPIHTGIAMTWEFIKKNYVTSTEQTLLLNRLSLNTGRIFWNNEVSYLFNSSPSLLGKLNSFLFFNPIRFLLRVDYTSIAFSAFEGELQYAFTDNNILSLTGRHQVDNRKNTVGTRLSRAFESFKAGLDFSYSNGSEYSAGVLLSFSLYREPYTGLPRFTSNAVAQSTLASVNVFNDKNRNGIKDPDESAMKNVNLVVNQREGTYKTNDDGIAVVGPLRPHRPADLSISLDSIEDPSSKPAFAGVRLVSRVGKVAEVNLPFITVGGIDGNVNIETAGKKEPMNRISVEIFDSNQRLISSVKTDRSGFYSFEDLKPGQYRITIPKKQLEGFQVLSSPPERIVTISEEGS